MRKKMIFIFGMLLVLITACKPTANVPSPDIVINDAMDAWNSGDVATLKALFTDNATVCFPDWGEECTTGQKAIGAWIEELVGANFIIEPESLEVNGDKVSVVAKVWSDPTRELGIAPLETTDVYTVQNGKITSQTSTLTEESSTKLMSAMAALANTVEVIPTSIQEIVGIWEGKVLSKKGYYQLREDGALFIAYTFDKLKNDPISNVPAQYWFEGEIYHIEDDCGHGKYLLTLTTEDGRNQRLEFQLIDDTCEDRIADYKTPLRWMRPYVD